jgi:hypothetical protein
MHILRQAGCFSGRVHGSNMNKNRNKIRYKMKKIGWIAGIAVLMAGASNGSTIGFVGAAAVNANIPTTYGSNLAADGTGWTTSDGATPDVTLTWNAKRDPLVSFRV